MRADRLSQLREVDAVVFDCDGVLVDVRESYNKAISKTSAYIFEGLTGYAVPESLISDEVIFLFRRSGGFNNDWDTVYGILMFMLCRLPKKTRGELLGLIGETGLQPDPFVRFSSIRDAVKRSPKESLDATFFEASVGGLKKFTERLDSTGISSVDKYLKPACSPSDLYDTLKRFIYWPPKVGENIIGTVFEEFFCGTELFQKTYGMKPRFHKGLGMIENEELIIRHVTLDKLASLFGKANLGIASGSRLKPAKYALGDLLERFNPKASVFLDDVEKAEHERSSKAGVAADLKKPNPFSLLRAAEAFGRFKFVLYVGDSMEDAIMARDAGKIVPRFLFAGVYCYSSCQDALLHDFLKYGADIVIPSVEELPLILEQLREKKDADS